jgi:8-oxo-dGTP pyrophosphatase MutT (NUDIX family)
VSELGDNGAALPVAVPRDAATVLLVRPMMGDGAEFYALRRPDSFRAFAGVWAFPGGTVSPEDRLPEWQGLLRPFDAAAATALAVERERRPPSVQTHRFRREKADMLLTVLGRVPDDPVPDPAADPATNLAVWVTAFRELFEETGILLAEGASAVPQADLENWRHLLRSGQGRFIDCLRDAGLRPDMRALRYMGRLCTPSFSRYRFDTRFFLARVPEGCRADGRRGAATEVAEEGWFPPMDLLRRNDAGTLRLMPPTRYVIELAAAHDGVDALWEAFGANGWDGGA